MLRRHKKAEKAANVLPYIPWLAVMGTRQKTTDGINCSSSGIPQYLISTKTLKCQRYGARIITMYQYRIVQRTTVHNIMKIPHLY